jgi:hypothetical protein
MPPQVFVGSRKKKEVVAASDTDTCKKQCCKSKTTITPDTQASANDAAPVQAVKRVTTEEIPKAQDSSPSKPATFRHNAPGGGKAGKEERSPVDEEIASFVKKIYDALWYGDYAEVAAFLNGKHEDLKNSKFASDPAFKIEPRHLNFGFGKRDLTPLMVTCITGNCALCELLLRFGVDADYQHPVRKTTALFCAIESRQHDVIVLLVSMQKVRLDLIDEFGDDFVEIAKKQYWRGEDVPGWLEGQKKNRGSEQRAAGQRGA